MDNSSHGADEWANDDDLLTKNACFCLNYKLRWIQKMEKGVIGNSSGRGGTSRSSWWSTVN